MSENIKGIAPLNWKAIVNETIQQRKAERMTQREHAALANVSIPTMAAFESGETTLSLTKAFAILRVVGLVNEPAEEDEQDVFVRESFSRWNTLTKDLPQRSPARFPDGWYRFDYYLEGNLKQLGSNKLLDILRKAVTNHSGWPPFNISTRKEYMPKAVNGTMEYWLNPKSIVPSPIDHQPASWDFWRITPTGRALLMRGYQEDSAETFRAQSIFDITLPIWRMGETLLHAERIAFLLQESTDIQVNVHFRALYTGLKGRVLCSWANPLLKMMIDERAALSDEALLKAVIPAYNISEKLQEYLYPLLSSLYSKFGVREFPEVIVQKEIESLLKKSREIKII